MAVGDARSFNQQRIKVVDRLKQMGAKEDLIYAAVGAKRIEDVDEDRLTQLIGLGTSIKNGDVTIEEAFPDVKREVDATNLFKNQQPTQAQPPADPPPNPKQDPTPAQQSTTVSRTVVNSDGTTTYTGPSKPKRAPKAATPPPSDPPTLEALCRERNLDFPGFCEAAANCGLGGIDQLATSFADIPADIADTITPKLAEIFKAAGV